MNSTERDIRLDESLFLLRQLTDLTRRGLLTWDCSEYHPIRLLADRENDSETWFITQSLTAWTYYEPRTYCAEVYEALRVLDGSGFIMVGIDYEEGTSRFDIGSGTKTPNVVCLFPKADMVSFADAVLPQLEDSEAVKAGFADRFSPYEDDVPPNSIRKQSLAKLGRILRQDRQVISFHRAVVTKSHRNSLLFGLRKEHD